MARIITILLLLASLVGQALADNVQEQAEWTIRNLIRDKTRYQRVYFSTMDSGFLSFSEAKVTGEGVASSDDGWGGMPFKFSIKVHRSDYRTRDARVEFRDGRTLTSRPDWINPAPPSSHSVRIDSPRWYENLRNNSVDIRGYAEGRGAVKITVYDRNGRRVGNATEDPDRAGRWSARFDLQNGNYRAVASRGGWSSGDEVRFSVVRSSGDWGWGGSGGSWGGSGGSGGATYVRIESPRNNSRVRGPSVRAEGRSDGRSVEVTLYEGSREVQRTYETVRNDRWSWSTRLSGGSYRLVAVSADGRKKAEVRFTVDSGDFGGSGGSGGSGWGGSGGSGGSGWGGSGGSGGTGELVIDSPRNGSRVRGPSVRASGRADAPGVQVVLYNGPQQVQRTLETVRNGRWNFSIRLANRGGYRLVVTTADGKKKAEVSFTVD